MNPLPKLGKHFQNDTVVDAIRSLWKGQKNQQEPIYPSSGKVHLLGQPISVPKPD